MICLNCNSTNSKIMYSESYPCSHCGGDLVVEYCMCIDCGTIWRAIDGAISTESVVNADDLMNILTPFNQFMNVQQGELSPEDQKMLDNIEKELNKHATEDGQATTMSDMLHKCLKCESVVHEAKPGYFECDECGFSWEVVSFD